MEHKWAAFHSMLHRVYNLPLSRENFDKEVAYIKEERLMSKHLFKRKIKEVTTLSPMNKESTTKLAGLKFHPGLSRKIANTMAKHDIQVVFKAFGKDSQVLGSPKDVVDEKAKSSIYEIKCQTCSVVYYGQTRREH
jgi:hypothetical protein